MTFFGLRLRASGIAERQNSLSGKKNHVNTTKIMLEPNQIYPYFGPQFNDAGLMKYGAVNVPSQLPRKFKAVAKPKQ